MDIVVTGRNVEVPEHFRQHVNEKLARIERYDNKVIRVDVELLHEPNRRQAAACQRVEITCKSRGPAVRSEACSDSFYSALDQAAGRLETRLRRFADRRRVHHGSRTPTSVAAATASLEDDSAVTAPPADEDGADEAGADEAGANGDGADDGSEQQSAALIVREKEHDGTPISVEQALLEMELVGHDFFLFADNATGQPSVVYRRKGYDYGLLRLRG